MVSAEFEGPWKDGIPEGYQNSPTLMKYVNKAVATTRGFMRRAGPDCLVMFTTGLQPLARIIFPRWRSSSNSKMQSLLPIIASSGHRKIMELSCGRSQENWSKSLAYYRWQQTIHSKHGTKRFHLRKCLPNSKLRASQSALVQEEKPPSRPVHQPSGTGGFGMCEENKTSKKTISDKVKKTWHLRVVHNIIIKHSY